MDYNWACKNINPNKLVDLTKDMVRIPSVTGNEEELSNFISSYLAGLGFNVEIFEAEKKRPNIVGTLKGSKGSPKLVLNGHMDTVPPGDLEKWKFDPYEGTLHENKIYGRGSCDMKGGLASMLTAVESIIESGETLEGDLIFTAVVDEERGSHKGTRILVEEGLTANHAIIAEPSKLEINIAHKGDIGLEIITHGKTGHAANPDMGINAIHKMASLMQHFFEIPERFNWDTEKKHELVGSPSLGISVIKGGLQRNMIPDFCSIVLDRRVVPTYEDIEGALNEIYTIIEEEKKKDPDLKIDINKILEVEASEISKDEEIVSILRRNFSRIMSNEPNITGVAYFSDAHFLVNQGGIPTAMFGPGSINQAHTIDEFIEIPQLINATKILAQTIAEYLIPTG